VRRILVGTDRSETAGRAVAFAAEMAERYGAELVVLQVVRSGTDAPSVERDLAPYAEGLGGRPLVRAGDDAARVIVDAARAEKVDIVVVGSVGMMGRKEFLLDNVPNRVSHNAPCTVVIVQTDREARR
jgi:nucleotide-binding universal stress UspA family protein